MPESQSLVAAGLGEAAIAASCGYFYLDNTVVSSRADVSFVVNLLVKSQSVGSSSPYQNNSSAQCQRFSAKRYIEPWNLELIHNKLHRSERKG